MKKKIIIGVLVVVIIIALCMLFILIRNTGINPDKIQNVSGEGKKELQKLTSVITKENYGDYIDYNYDYNGNGDNSDDWRIFFNDGENVYLIASNVIPDELVPEEKSYENFDFLDDRLVKYFSFAEGYDKKSTQFTKAMNKTAKMLDLTNWESFVNENADYAIGGPTIDLLLEQYNEIYDEKIDYKVSEFGYEVKNEEASEWDVSADFTESNDLYFINNTIGSFINVASTVGGYDVIWNDSDLSRTYSILKNYNYLLGITEMSIGSLDSDVFGDGDYKPIICLKADTIGEEIDGVWNIK